MTIIAIRKARNVPARRGMRCRVDGKPGVITSARGGYINVKFDGESFTRPCHPTWRFEYILADGSVKTFGMEPSRT